MEQNKVEVEIFNVLLSTSLYLAAATTHRDILEFNAGRWHPVFEEASRHGSEVFGIRKALENSAWLKEHKESLEGWFVKATEWWVREDEEAEEKKRSVLKDALVVMKSELTSIFERVERLHSENQRAFAAVSRNQV
ncbi:uncharacterized protein JCM6883_003085 [Sporobolomyces salmoneus]|uniref:uncharacterized protein n=1 Tax=Sporobolomyces salmoneus TaxID=183962 RepID=UPI00316B2A53